MKQHIYKAMFWLLPWLCAVPLASCSFDDDIDTGDDGTATLQLSITAREEGEPEHKGRRRSRHQW